MVFCNFSYSTTHGICRIRHTIHCCYNYLCCYFCFMSTFFVYVDRVNFIIAAYHSLLFLQHNNICYIQNMNVGIHWSIHSTFTLGGIWIYNISIEIHKMSEHLCYWYCVQSMIYCKPNTAQRLLRFTTALLPYILLPLDFCLSRLIELFWIMLLKYSCFVPGTIKFL